MGAVCWNCAAPMVPGEDIYCHDCNVALDMWLDELTDDKPYND